jgi:hypothetical protein
MLTTPLHLPPRLRINGVVLLNPPIRLTGVNRYSFTFYLTHDLNVHGAELQQICLEEIPKVKVVFLDVTLCSLVER